MGTQPAKHPSAAVLQAFGLGKLDASSSGALLAHLDYCAECRQVVASQSGDEFLERIRQAHSRSATPAPPKSLGGVEAKPKPPPGPTTLFNLPPELADNPQYELLRELGHGGMGVVYLAKNKLMDRLEVLKVINKALLDRPGAIERFLREIRAAAKLNHVNVVAAYSALQLGDLLVFAMEHVEGQDLAAVVKENGPLPVPHACFYVQQAAQGLQHAFEKQMVHRDIKPQNLMLARDGRKHLVKVLDFGLAKVIREKSEDTGLTGEGKMLGTPDYMAPEQTLDATSADIRADIYSLGCTLYFLLSGSRPFMGKNLYDIMQAHQSLEAPALNLARPEVPAELAAVVRKMMAKDRGLRYQTPLEVVQALKPFLKQVAASKSSPGLSAAGPKAARGVSVPAVTTVDPPVPTAAVTQLPPLPAPVAWESLTDSVIASARSGKSGAVDKPRSTAGEAGVWKRWLMGGGVAAGLLLLGWLSYWLAGVMLHVETPNGTLIVEMNDDEVEARIKHGKLILTGPDGKVRYTLTAKERSKKLEEGSYKIRVEGADGLVLDTPEFILKKGDEVKVRVTLKATGVAKKEPPNLDADRKAVPPPPSKELDALRRDQIAPEALAVAGDGDPKRAPASLVGLLGEVVPFHTEAVLGLAYSPDGRWLATGSADKTIMLRDAATGEVKRILKGHTKAVSAVAFSKDSKSLVSTSHDGTLKLWSVDREEAPKTLGAEIGPVLTMAASPDGRFVAAGGADRAIKLWKWGQWDKPGDLPALTGKVSSLAFSPDGELLASSWDGRVRIYQTSDGKPTQTWPADNSNQILAFSGNGKWLVSTGNCLQVWEVASGKLLTKIGEAAQFNTLAIHPDGNLVYACNGGGLGGFTYDLPSLKRPEGTWWYWVFREPVGICTATYSPNGKFLAFGTGNGGVHVWDYAKVAAGGYSPPRFTPPGEKQLPKGGHSHYISTLSVSHDGRTVLSGGDDNALRQWDVARPSESKLIDKNELVLNHVAFSPDGEKYATSASFIDYDTWRRGDVWDAPTGKKLFSVDPTFHGYSVVFSPDGKLLAGCGQGGENCVILWDANNGKQLHRFPKMGVCLDRPAFSRDGKRVAAATTDTKAVKVWDVGSGEEVASWTDPKPMCAVALSPDGRLLAAGHHDGAISLWDVAAKGRKKRSWEGHSATITRLQFTPDGKTLVSSSADGTIRLWSPEAARSREIITLGPANRPLTFDLDPSGKYLFAAGHTPLIFILRLP